MKNLFFLLLLLFNFFMVRGQKGVVDYLQAPEIMNGGADAYLAPMAHMLSTNMQGAWYKSAKAHRYLGYDISIGAISSGMPAQKRGYRMADLPDFSEYYTIKNINLPFAANVAGKTENSPVIFPKNGGADVALPKGEGRDHILLPIISGGIGLPYNTDLRVKFTPKIDMGSIGSVFQYGIGIKHSIKEYIPGLKEFPAMSLAAFGGYSSLNNETDLSYPSADMLSQKLQGSATSYTGRLILGFDVPVFSAYMGLGYASTSMAYALKGKYYVGDVMDKKEETDPLTLNYDLGKIDFDFGMKAKLGNVQIFTAYSPGNYTSFTFGAGINIR